MNRPYLHDISGLSRLLLVFGLLVAAAASVVSRMIGPRGRSGLPMQFLGLAILGVIAVTGLIAKPEWGAAVGEFLYAHLVSPVLPERWTQLDDTKH